MNAIFDSKRSINIEILSDTHFELSTSYKMKRRLDQHFKGSCIYYSIRNIDQEDEYNVLCCPGDICSLNQLPDFLDIVVDKYDWIFFTPGNHEYWDNDMDQVHDRLLSIQSLYKNVTIFTPDNDVVYIFDDLAIWSSTLWSYIPPNNEHLEKELNDYRYIRTDGRLMTIDDSNKWHSRAVNSLNNHLSNTSVRTIVMTHHVPSMRCVNASYKDGNNYGYITDLEYIMNPSILLWIYGHNHYNIMTNVNGTLLCTNQWGYAYERNGFHRLIIKL